ncbi:MAG: YqgE/AlgH family protein [Gammaproteobacteria bacterium]|nr:YqgE/AlgH family protein [Gammaproteobacteria bacterium]
MQTTNLTSHFLIAMPALADPNFQHTVTFICAHNEEGAMGIVINRQLDFILDEVLSQMELQPLNDTIGNTHVYQGGPVQTDRGFILHTPEKTWESSIQISDGICVTTSRDILEAIASGEGPQSSLVALGYAGWGAGQLEREIVDNAWLSGPADTDIIFNTPCEQRWQSAAHLLGVDIQILSSDIGHA